MTGRLLIGRRSADIINILRGSLEGDLDGFLGDFWGIFMKLWTPLLSENEEEDSIFLIMKKGKLLSRNMEREGEFFDNDPNT